MRLRPLQDLRAVEDDAPLAEPGLDGGDASFEYFWPQAQPLCSGVAESNRAKARTLAASAPGPSLNTGLLSKKTSVRSDMPAASGWLVSTLTVSTEPGTKYFVEGIGAPFSTR